MLREDGTGDAPQNVRAKVVAGVNRRVFAVAVIAMVLAPLAVAAAVLVVRIGPDLLAAVDNAEAELRVRDIGSRPVFLGLYSRDGWSHPGPLLFYLLLVPYRAAGSSSIGLYLGALTINVGAIVGILLTSRRLGGTSFFLLAAAGMTLLIKHLGPAFLSDPWSPFVTVMPFGALVFLCWAITCDVRWMIPVAVAVASFCVQTHVGYLPLTVPLVVWAIGFSWFHGNERRASLPRELLISVVVGVVLWLPPLIQQLEARRGNMSALWRYFTDPPGARHSLAAAYGHVSRSFAPDAEWLRTVHKWNSFRSLPDPTEPVVPLLLIAFVAVGFVALLRGARVERTFFATVAVAIAAGIISVWRTSGPVIDYRLGWVPIVAVTTLSGTIWMAWRLARHRLTARTASSIGTGSIAILLIFIVVMSVASLPQANSMKLNIANADSAEVAPALLAAAQASLPKEPGQVIVNVVPGNHPSPRTVLPGLVLWLETHGYDARLPVLTHTQSESDIFDDTRLVFGEHRLCDGSKVAARLVVIPTIADRLPPPPSGYRLVAKTSYLSVFFRTRLGLYVADEPAQAGPDSCR